jgi:hypothetical protein
MVVGMDLATSTASTPLVEPRYTEICEYGSPLRMENQEVSGRLLQPYTHLVRQRSSGPIAFRIYQRLRRLPCGLRTPSPRLDISQNSLDMAQVGRNCTHDVPTSPFQGDFDDHRGFAGPHPPRYDSAGNSSVRVCRQEHNSSKWNVRIGTCGRGSRGSSSSQLSGPDFSSSSAVAVPPPEYRLSSPDSLLVGWGHAVPSSPQREIEGFDSRPSLPYLTA